MKSTLFPCLALTCASLSAQVTFQTSRINIGCNPISVLTGDFNGDRTPDAAFACKATSANPIIVMLGNGDGTFKSPAAVSGPALGTVIGNKLVAADFDRDGKTDLAYIAANGNLIVLLSAGDGTFRSLVTTPSNTKLALAAAADLSNAGSADLIFFSGLNDSLFTYALGKGDGTFGTPAVIPWPVSVLAPNNINPNPYTTNVVTTDLNGDGRQDLIVAASRTTKPFNNGTPFQETYLFTLFNQGGGLSTPQLTVLSGNTGDLVADFDGDGKPDLASWGDSGATSKSILVVLHFPASGGVDSGIAADGPVRAADVNGDGKADLLVGSGTFNGIGIYTYNGTTPNNVLQRLGFVDLGSTPVDLAIVDLNGDGKPDFVSANTSSATIAINTTVISAALSGALNGASFATGQPMAPGSLASLFGTALASAVAQASSIPLPVSLGSVSVTVGGVPAPLLYVSGTQINFQVPWTVPVGQVDVVATVNGAAVAPLHVTIGAVAPGIFSTQSGTGQAIAINSDGSLAAPEGSIPGIATHPAKPGDTILILGTGLGAVSPSIATGAASTDALRTTTVTPSVLVGGTPAQVAFSGLSPQFVGVNQLNVVVPSVSGGVVSLQLDAGGIKTTDKVTIAVAK